MSYNFEELLTKSAAEVKPDAPLPAGTWKLKGIGATKTAPTETRPGSISFGYTPVAPQDDVDPSEVADEKWMGRRVWKRFPIESEGDVASVVKHAAKHGIDLEGKSVTDVLDTFGKVKPVIFAAVGIRNWTNKDGEIVTENTLKDFAADVQ